MADKKPESFEFKFEPPELNAETKKRFNTLKKYGFNGKNFGDVLQRLVAENKLSTAKKMSNEQKTAWENATKKLGFKPKEVVIPKTSQIIPAENMFLREAAKRGKLMADNMRQTVSNDLRRTIQEFINNEKLPAFIRPTGTKAGTINPKLIESFAQRMKKTFENYVKRDPKIGAPANIRSLAITATRETVSSIKAQYARTVADENRGSMKVFKMWVHNPFLSVNPRKTHMRMNAKAVPLDGMFKVKNEDGGTDLMDRPHDPNAPAGQVIGCLPGKNKIFATKLKHATRRKYSGKIYSIKTSGGMKLSATPNHPVLTTLGWKPISLIKKGDNVISMSRSNLSGLVDTNVKNIPFTIAKVFDTLKKSSIPKRIAGVNVNFHGEVPKGNVDIVFSERLLGDSIKPTQSHHVDNFSFTGPNLVFGSLPSFSSASQLRRCCFFAAHRIMSFLREFFLFIIRHSFVSENSSSRTTAPFNSIFSKALHYGSSVTFKLLCNLVFRRSGLIKFDDVVRIDVRSFRGSVFNLGTHSNIFLANELYHICNDYGIVTHNCNCDLIIRAEKNK